MLGDAKGEEKVLSVYGRKVKVPWAAGGVARFSFKELCEKPLGPADYITLGSEFVRTCPSHRSLRAGC